MSSVWRLGSGYSSYLFGRTWPGLWYISVFLLFLKFCYSGKTFKWKAFIPYRIFSCPGQLNLGDLVNESVSQWRLDFSAECRAGGRQCDWQLQRQRHQEWFSEFLTKLAKLELWRWALVIDNHFVLRSKINSTVNLWHLAQMFTIELCLGVRGALNTTIDGGSMDCHYVWRCWTQILGSGKLSFLESWDLGHSNLQVFTIVFVSWHAIGWRRSGLA